MRTSQSGRLGRWASAILETPRVWLDRDLRVRMTDHGYSVLDGDLEAAIEGLESVVTAARSRAVTGWANAGLAFTYLAAGRWDDAERVAARHPNPASDPLLTMTMALRGGRLESGLGNALAGCTFAVAAAGAARIILAEGRLDEVVEQALQLAPADGAHALLALQMGLHINRDHAAAIQVGERLHERASGWDISAYWLALDQAALGDQSAALRWLNRATDAGFSAVAVLDKEPRFESMRTLPAFAEVRNRMLQNPRRPADTSHGGLLWAGRRR
jgi:hypothetical protein